MACSSVRVLHILTRFFVSCKGGKTSNKIHKYTMSNSVVCFRSNIVFLSCFLLSLLATDAFAPSQRSRRISGLRLSSTAALDGIVKQVTTQGNGKAVNLGDIATVRYSCYVSGNKNALPVARADRQKMVSEKSCDSIYLSRILLTLFWKNLGGWRWNNDSWMG